MCALRKYFSASKYDYTSEMCNITPLETEMTIRQRTLRRKLFDLAGDTAVVVMFHFLSA